MSSFLFSKLVSFRPPRLLNNALGWHIEYYILDPVSGKLQRKRFRPTELTRLHVRDIDKENGIIYFPDTATKCHRGRMSIYAIRMAFKGLHSKVK